MGKPKIKCQWCGLEKTFHTDNLTCGIDTKGAGHGWTPGPYEIDKDEIIAAKDARIAELEEAMGIEIETQQTYKRLAIEKDAQISALNQKVEKLWAANKKARDKIFSLIIPYRKHINLESDTLKDIAADLAIDAITPSREKGEI